MELLKVNEEMIGKICNIYSIIVYTWLCFKKVFITIIWFKHIV